MMTSLRFPAGASLFAGDGNFSKYLKINVFLAQGEQSPSGTGVLPPRRDAFTAAVS